MCAFLIVVVFWTRGESVYAGAGKPRMLKYTSVSALRIAVRSAAVMGAPGAIDGNTTMHYVNFLNKVSINHSKTIKLRKFNALSCH